MRDKILEVGSWFDWISPILAVAQDLAHGGSHTFLLPWASGWSGREIARLLKQHGIESWGHMVINGTLTISVRPAQARWAQYVLDRAGIPIEGGRVEQRGPAVSFARGRSRRSSRSLGAILRDIWNEPLF